MEFCIHLTEVLIAAFLILINSNLLMKAKETLAFRIFLLVISGIIYEIFMYSFSFSENIIFLIILAFTFVFCYTQYQVNWCTALFNTLSITAIFIACKYISHAYVKLLNHTYLLGNDKYSIVLTIIMFSLIFVIICIERLLLHSFNMHTEVFSYSGLFLSAIPALTLYLSQIIFKSAIFDNNFSKSSQVYVITIGIMVILTTLITMYNNCKTQQILSEKIILQKSLQKDADIKEYTNEIKRNYDIQRILIHDIKNHLTSIKSLNETNNKQKVNEYIDNLLAESARNKQVLCSKNNMINAIILRYSTVCHENNITFYSDIRSTAEININDDDCSAILCNLLDNALASANKVHNGHIDISIEKIAATQFTKIALSNSCMTNPLNENGDFINNHTGLNTNHGVGHISIKRIIKKYRGEIETYYKTDDMTLHTVILLKSGIMS